MLLLVKLILIAFEAGHATSLNKHFSALYTKFGKIERYRYFIFFSLSIFNVLRY